MTQLILASSFAMSTGKAFCNTHYGLNSANRTSLDLVGHFSCSLLARKDLA